MFVETLRLLTTLLLVLIGLGILHTVMNVEFIHQTLSKTMLLIQLMGLKEEQVLLLFQIKVLKLRKLDASRALISQLTNVHKKEQCL